MLPKNQNSKNVWQLKYLLIIPLILGMRCIPHVRRKYYVDKGDVKFQSTKRCPLAVKKSVTNISVC